MSAQCIVGIRAWCSASSHNAMKPGRGSQTRVCLGHPRQEYICGAESAYHDQEEIFQAKRAVRLAESALKAAQRRPSSPGGSTSTHLPTVSVWAATSRRDEAKRALQFLKQRHNVIIEFQQATSSFRNRKDDIRRRDLLIQWILDEMPLVEGECANLA